MTTDAFPGLAVEVVPPPPEQDVLRTDVAAILGRTRRGPLGAAIRVEGWMEFQRWYGPADGTATTPDAVRGFFENGGRTTWVLRVAGPSRPASTLWTVGGQDGEPLPVPAGFTHARYRVVATSPGGWANNTRIRVRYQASSVAGPPAVSVRVSAPGEPPETFSAMPPAAVVAGLDASRLVRLLPDGPPLPPPAEGAPGPLVREWELVLGTLPGGSAAEQDLVRGVDTPPAAADYRSAAEAQAALPEPALVALPDLTDDLSEPDRTETVRELLDIVRAPHDRLLVLDIPATSDQLTAGPPAAGQIALRATGPEPSGLSADAAVAWVAGLRALGDDGLLGCAAVYHPRLRVRDELTAGGDRLRSLPSSGHVLGVIARLDGERGPHHTPANAVLLEAVDLDPRYPPAQEVRLFEGGVNLLRCAPGHGLQVWGGRTLATGAGSRYVAHRRLVHLLVRSIRRVADPLVFEVNGPELRLTLVRGITSVLLAAFRSGALAGGRAEQAFQVICDDSNNPPEQPPDMVVCEVEVAPAAPMEFIRIRVALGQDRGLEVLET